MGEQGVQRQGGEVQVCSPGEKPDSRATPEVIATEMTFESMSQIGFPREWAEMEKGKFKA